MLDYSVLDAVLDAAHIKYKTDEPMRLHTTFKIGGPADRFVSVENAEQLKTVLRALRENGMPYLVLGNGSNMLVPDDGLRGAVIVLDGEFKQISLTDDNTVLCGSGAMLAALCGFARSNTLTGLEFAWGIPGAVGGALYMNAGAYGGEMKQVVKRVFYMDEDGTQGVLSGDALGYGYRKSAFMGTGKIILKAELALSHGVETEISAMMDDLMQRRKSKQPVELPSAGSVFKRPEGHFAGALVEQCGLKGCTVGGAQVSEKHAGFIVNIGGATCADVEALIAHIQRVVMKETGVALEPEVRRVHL
ncbi:MAG: UDP-N-acetylmuramate dehydrogenase [Clostridia bacterium]|nr:UDP-N-acetylmuramate dehydrogenase [Clostridia bacterium]